MGGGGMGGGGNERRENRRKYWSSSIEFECPEKKSVPPPVPPVLNKPVPSVPWVRAVVPAWTGYSCHPGSVFGSVVIGSDSVRHNAASSLIALAYKYHYIRRALLLRTKRRVVVAIQRLARSFLVGCRVRAEIERWLREAGGDIERFKGLWGQRMEAEWEP